MLNLLQLMTVATCSFLAAFKTVPPMTAMPQLMVSSKIGHTISSNLPLGISSGLIL
jgi:hypothetical protein